MTTVGARCLVLAHEFKRWVGGGCHGFCVQCTSVPTIKEEGKSKEMGGENGGKGYKKNIGKI